MESHVDILQGYTPDRGKSRSKVFSGWNINWKSLEYLQVSQKSSEVPIYPQKGKIRWPWAGGPGEQEVENKRPQR